MPNWPAGKLGDQTIGLDIVAAPLPSAESAKVTSLLMRANVSSGGAREFAQGRPVASVADRMRRATACEAR
jgi:hypothetical protein